MTASDLTKERDLRESTPLWADTPRISVRSGKTPKDNHYDTIVVGTGISGALVAHSLTDANPSKEAAWRAPQ